jgi:hypothetical protein
MADKRITDLPLILSGDVSSLDVLPIVNVELDVTNKITADQLKAYINSGFTDVFVTGGTYDNNLGELIFINNTGGTFNINGLFTGNTDVFVTGGTYSNGITIFTNNTGGTFNVVGYYTGETSYVNSLTTGTGLSGDTTTGNITLINTAPDQVVTITGGTNLSVVGSYPNFGVEFTGSTSSFFTGGTVSGATNFTNGLSADTFSATTISGGTLYGDGSNLTGIPDIYITDLAFNLSNYNLTVTRNDLWSDMVSLSILASDLTVTGGTYDSGTGTGTFTNNTGGTFTVTGFLVGYTDTKVTGFTYDNINTFTIYDNSGTTFNASITTLSATTISGGTFYGDGSNLTGVGGAGAEVTGFTYDNLNNLTILDSTGGTFSVNVDVMSALTVTNGLSGGTISITNSPSVSVSPTYILSRNSLTGEIEFTAYSAITRTIDPFNNVGSASTVTWDVSGTSANYEVTLTANTTLNIINVRNGDYGTIILKQDGVGSRTLTFGTINGTSGTNRHKVANGGGGNVFLTSNPNAVDLLTFAYNGTNLYWTIGNDYT